MASHSTLPTPELHKMTSEEFSLNIGLRQLRGKIWNPAGRVPVLALHGWLDNANSFGPVGERLVNIKLQALDLAGHGKSDFRSADAGYDLLDELRDLDQVVEQLSADRPVQLLGHSRGGVICALYAAVFPDRVDKLALIDALEPFPSHLDGLPETIAQSIRDAQKLSAKAGNFYSSREAGLAARIQGLTAVSARGAEWLAERSLVESDNGWQWHADQRLKGVSGFRVSNEMRVHFYRRITAPALLIEPAEGMLQKDGRFTDSGQHIPHLQRIHVPGGHYCHLDDCPQRVVEILEDWFSA